MNVRARVERGVGITGGVFAVDTDTTVLNGLHRIKSKQRILFGTPQSGSDGVSAVSGPGAEVIGSEGDRIIDAVRAAKGFAETDAFMVLCGAAGSTGSKIASLLTQKLKERHFEKPVYNLIVLPFEDEVTTGEATFHNTATCLKSAYAVADAIFLIDNQKYAEKDASVKDELAKLNASVVELFYEMLCAGEETRRAYIGSKLLDAGDIIQTLRGWSVIGQGKVPIPRWGLTSIGKGHFREKVGEAGRGTQVLDTAISKLSLKCNPADARRALYLLAAPAGEMSVELMGGLGTSVKEIAPAAIIRGGDYPRGRDSLSITIVLSEFPNLPQVAQYLMKAPAVVTPEIAPSPVPMVAGPSAQPETQHSDEQADKPEDSV